MSLAELAPKLYDAKRREYAAKKERIALEEQIAMLVETGDKGSKTVDAGEGLKVFVKRDLSYKADIDNLCAVAKSLNAQEAPIKVVPETLAFDDKVYEAMRESNPVLFAEFAKHVTVTPKKVSVTLKLV